MAKRLSDYPKAKEAVKGRHLGDKPKLKENRPKAVPRSVTGNKKLKRSKPF